MMLAKTKPKIAILTIRNTYNYGGVLSSLKIVYSFCEQYFQPTVFFLGFDNDIATSLRSFKLTSSCKPLSYFGMKCFEIGARWAFWEPGHYYFTQPKWQHFLKDYTYFFVVSGTCIAAHPLVLLNKKFTMWVGTTYDDDRIERVKQLRGIRRALNFLSHKKMNIIEKTILQKAGFTWAISTYTKSKFEQILGSKKNILELCGYPIDCVPSLNSQERAKESIILAVGRFSDPRKNIDMLIRVFDKLHTQLPKVKLYVVGMKPSLEKLASFSTLRSYKSIIFTGQITSDDLNTLYAKASVLLITSYQEGLGIVGLEALFHGVPVVATDCGGTRDYVINDVTGYLVPINDDDAMVNKTYNILFNQQLRKRLTLGGQELIKEQFSINKVYTQFQHGLSICYPELAEWFVQCNAQKPVKSARSKPLYW